MADFELENEFADKSLVVVWRERSVDRQFPLLKLREVRIKVRVVLVMHTADVTEARHAHREQIRSGPQLVAIDELRARGIFHRGVSAGNSVTGLLQLAE